MHYQRWRIYGDVHHAGKREDLDRRFGLHVEREPGGCWLWVGALYAGGYGQMWTGRTVPAHRWAYERFVGVIPDGCHLHHRCENKRCVNPDHLEPLTPVEHRKQHPRAPRPAKSHCVHGHALVGTNLFVNSQGGRVCRTCHRERARRAKAKAREHRGA